MFIEVTYNNHTFSRLKGARNPKSSGVIANPIFRNPANGDIAYSAREDQVEYFSVTSNLVDLDFEDITTNEVYIQVAGGLCNRSLGLASVILTRQKCSLAFMQRLEIEKFNAHGEKSFILPAHEFELEFEKLAGLTGYSENMRGFFERTEQLKQYIDLVILDQPIPHRSFIYHPKPSIVLTMTPVQDIKDCKGTFVLEKSSFATATIALSQAFELGDSVPDCPNVDANVKIFSDMSTTVALTDSCSQGCELPVYRQLNNVTGKLIVVKSLASHSFIAGDPTATAPFTRDFYIEVNVLGYVSPTVTEVVVHAA